MQVPTSNYVGKVMLLQERTRSKSIIVTDGNFITEVSIRVEQVLLKMLDSRKVCRIQNMLFIVIQYTMMLPKQPIMKTKCDLGESRGRPV